MGWSASTPKEKTEIVKNGFDILIKSAFVMLIAACIFIPDFIKKASKFTGLNVVALASGKLEPYAEKIEQLNQQLAETTSIVEIQKKAIDTARANNPQNFNDGFSAADSSRLSQTLSRVIARNETVLKSSSELASQTPVEMSSSISWGVVSGGDKTREGAADEINWLKARGYSTTLFQRQGWFRTVALFPTRTAAYDALGAIRQRNATAYAVDIAKWCPGRVTGAAFDTCPGDGN
jgi:hypothetical protein